MICFLKSVYYKFKNMINKFKYIFIYLKKATASVIIKKTKKKTFYSRYIISRIPKNKMFM